MDIFEDEELAVMAIALDEEEETHRRKRKWVEDIWRNRDKTGEHATLFRELANSDNDRHFSTYFRMTKPAFDLLLSELEPMLRKQDTFFRKAIEPSQRLALCLSEINTIWNFPNCLGALDGKHITIQAPPNSGSTFFNYKKTFSVVLLALVDANCNFIAVDVGAYGRNSDGGIFASSVLGKALAGNRLNVPEAAPLPGTNTLTPHVIVGDEAFPLKPYLMRPYPGDNLDNAKRIFNYRLSRIRRASENTFGIYMQMFRIFNRPIQAKPENVDKIIMAAIVLYQFIPSLQRTAYLFLFFWWTVL
ncbi:conserved hypothetical protein [Culex quinquefasciatus]|uniref:DDE Tnp4 domain-containing protein n=1 Tax=Culex quinquefasciatus TaxID=7176 RepID=B0XGI7_CULQU|nr:conserved hypothetical protein [Culex quinquefasciatus]|eukprot:XP_001868759.1 conserved hypothetical protein [Culex quinquefasciatus]